MRSTNISEFGFVAEKPARIGAVQVKRSFAHHIIPKRLQG